MKEATPTFDDYFAAIRNRLKNGYLSDLTEPEIDEYLQREYDTIQGWYQRSKKDFEAGEITRRHFMEGSVGGSVYALHMMY